MKFSGVDVHSAGRSLFQPPPHPGAREEAEVQTYPSGDNSAERRVFCFSKPAHSHRMLVDVLLRWPSYCLNGF